MEHVEPAMVYSRDIPAAFPSANIESTRQHVRDHLASVADANDDPSDLADLVDLEEVDLGDGILRIVGTLDRQPVAPYLHPDYDPDQAEAQGL